MQLIQSLVFAFLLLDVLTDSFFVSADSGYKVSPGPEAGTRKVFLSPKKRPRNVDGALAFDVAYHLSNPVLRRDGDEHMNMVRHQVAFQYVALPLPGQLPEHLTEIPSQLFVEDFPPAFWNPHHMVLAVPYCVA
jgi:hypothetical protein